MSRLLTRRWLVAHVAIAVAVATCVLAGRWQLRRLEERRSTNALLVSRSALPPVGAGALAGAGADLAYRRASLTGTYDGERQILLSGRTLRGTTGSEVLTPLRTREGITVLVVRSWVRAQTAGGPFAVPPPPSGTVRAAGVLVPGTKARVAGSGSLDSIPALDIDRIARQLPYGLAPLALRLESQDPPPDAGQPLPAGLPPPGDGPHLAYAIQWFLFAAVFLTGYAVLIRRAFARAPE